GTGSQTSFHGRAGCHTQRGASWFNKVCGSWLDAQYHMTNKLTERVLRIQERLLVVFQFPKSCSQIRTRCRHAVWKMGFIS
ncbi:Uncharacterized protein DAT39_000367, partial [Clarias magur]